MTDMDQEDSWYKHCASCQQWRITDMKHCWQCGEVLGPPCSLALVKLSHQLAVTDTVQTRVIYRLWERAKEHGYEHELPTFMQFLRHSITKGASNSMSIKDLRPAASRLYVAALLRKPEQGFDDVVVASGISKYETYLKAIEQLQEQGFCRKEDDGFVVFLRPDVLKEKKR